ncbi:MAG: YceI family protein [Bacteriovoracaceae bacterium]|nr:YceI family protein [Bacteriovoracaceae bacterium]
MKTYQIDPSHSSVNFSIRHMMIAKVHGGFEKLSGSFLYDSHNPAASKVEVVIESNSINTREAQRDAHLKSADFFDVEKYPSIIFKSTDFKEDGDDLSVLGELTIHGVTKQVKLNVERPSEELKDPWGNLKIGVSGKTKINRKDFDLGWNAALEAGGFLVGEEVSISFDIQLAKVEKA